MFDVFTPYVLQDLATKGALLVGWTICIACIVAVVEKAIARPASR